MPYLKALAVVFLGLAFVVQSHAQYEAYELVGGNYLPGVVDSQNRGQYLRVRPVGALDTLWMWIQHSAERVDPQYESAEVADVVLWCRPDRYPHEDHVMPNAGDIAVRLVELKAPRFRQEYLLVVDISREKMPADEDIRQLLIRLAQSRQWP